MNIKVKLVYDDIAIPIYVKWTFTDPLHSGKISWCFMYLLTYVVLLCVYLVFLIYCFCICICLYLMAIPTSRADIRGSPAFGETLGLLSVAALYGDFYTQVPRIHHQLVLL